MDGLTIFWLMIAVATAIVESLTPQLICIWFCLSAVVSAIVAQFTDSVWLTIVVFVVCSALFLFLTRPVVKKKITTKIQPTNYDRIIGKDAIVTEDINPAENAGQIKVDGQVWSAKSTEPIPQGSTVRIEAIEGVKAVVTK